MDRANPIFIHALFRSGSTYIFNAFRRSAAGYWCYEEPDHELFLRFGTQAKELLEITDSQNVALRHPALDRSYLAEYLPILEGIAATFTKEIPYDSYFLSAEQECSTLERYLNLLLDSAKGRPVLQFCRSSGRITWLRRHFGGTHIFLWRNPWDQWWSFQVEPYFNTINLLILNAATRPPVITALRDTAGVQSFNDSDIDIEFIFHFARRLRAEQGYFVFYGLWCYAMLEGHAACDMMVSIDGLSLSNHYRAEVIARLEDLGCGGVDFSDCQVYRGAFTADEARVFSSIEDRVHGLFGNHGYDAEALMRLRTWRSDYCATLPNDATEASDKLTRDLVRSRELFWNREELAVAEAANAERLRSEIERQRAELAPLRQVEGKLRWELSVLYDSPSWKVTAPLRAAIRLLRPGYRRVKSLIDR